MRLSRPTRGFIVSAISLLLVMAVWWFQDQGDDEATDAGRDDATPSAVASTQHTAPSSTARSTPTSSPTSAPTSASHDEHGLAWIDVADLPPEADDTLELIDDGGPFPYDKDGSTFGNFEGILPDRERGYYAEYTVDTPGLSHRGARRIVTGDGGEFYWTEDHYESFERIRR